MDSATDFCWHCTGILEKDEKICHVESAIFTTAGFSEVSDTLVTGGYDKQAMSDAIQHARKETDQFIEIMNKKDADTFAVKAPIT